MRGLCRDRSLWTAVCLAALMSTSSLLVVATGVQANEPIIGPKPSTGNPAVLPATAHNETDWPLRTFAQPAFKPDFAAMSATIAAEPPPPAAPPLATPLSVIPSQVTQSSDTPRRNKTPVTRVAQPTETAEPAAPKLRLGSAWPKTLPEARAETARASGQQAETYAPQDIAAAKAHCAAVMQGLDAVAVPEEPIRQGNCGSAAPVQLISIGRSPQVTFNPPAIVTCDMVAALATWLKNDLQPAARRHLGSPLAKIETMSSYSCRNAYGRKRGNLSEHGRANALDIRSFVTAAQAESEVLAHWGPTTREVRAQVAAAKAAADKAVAERAIASAKLPLRSTVPPGAPETTPNTGTSVAGAVGTMIGSVPGIAARLPGIKSDTSLSWTPPSRLGGPKPADKSTTETAKQAGNHAGRTQFLREAHTSACRIFGTVLGPEANDAHKNHFHVDMAERAGGHFCE
jgi:hypothetical protein